MTATTIDYIIVRLVASERRLRRQATTTGRRRPTTTAAAILLCAALYSRPMATATNRNSGVAVTQWYSVQPHYKLTSKRVHAVSVSTSWPTC